MKQNDDEITNTYIIDVSQGRETGRLTEQGRLLTDVIGLPEFAPSVKRVLDLACGPGEWVLEVAHAHPEIEFVGIDRDRKMIHYATTQASIQNLTNVTFLVNNVREGLSFADEYFDFVHARFMMSFMRPEDWPKLLRECKRVLGGSGVLEWTESEWDISTSSAYEHFKRLVFLACFKAGQSCSVDGYHFGISPMMTKFTRESGFQSILKAHAVESSYGTPYYESAFFDIRIALSLLPQFLLQQQVIQKDKLRNLCAKILEEMEAETYCAVAALFTVIAKV